MDLFFKESRQFKLDVTLKAIVSSDLVVLALTDFGTEWNIIHGQDHLQEILIVKEAVLVLVEVGEHMEALSFADVVHHVVLKKLIDVVGTNLA